MAFISIFHGLDNVAQQQMVDMFKNFPKAVNNLAGILANNALTIWAESAINKSTSYGKGYASALRIEIHGATSSRVYADESNRYFQTMENGIKAWSIRDALLASPKAKSGKNGKYIIVPFRWAVPKKDVSKPAKGFSGILSKDAWQAAKSGQSVSGAMAMTGREKSGQSGFMTGLKRYGSERHGQYMTFRCVSERKTPASAWMHPGKTTTPVFDSILPFIEKMVTKVCIDTIKDFQNIK